MKLLRLSFISLLFFSSLFTACQGAATHVVSVASLLKEMTSREQLTKFPEPQYITKHASSYDRRSISANDKFWFANWDNNQWTSVEENNGRTEYVLLDTDQPGAITHFWMTGIGENRGQGTLRIYIDDVKKPVISQTLRSFIGENKAVGYPLSCSVSPLAPVDERGHNLYFPIPYAQSCKITYESDLIIKDERGKGEVLYYNIDYRTYIEDVEIESFTKTSIADNKDLIVKTNQLLLNGGSSDKVKQSKGFESFDITLNKDAEVVISQKNIGAAIHEINMRVQEDNPRQSMRSAILKCTFDNSQTVWVPIGDFFGSGYKITPYETRYNKVSGSGNLTSKWIMPFEKSCQISLKNIGDVPIRINGSLQFNAYDWTNRSMHFYTSWHQFTGIETGKADKSMDGGNGIQDLNYVTLSGQGVYVGDVLTLFNDNAPLGKTIWEKEDGTFRHCWWGEGDEKIYIDGEAFPSHFGTGTEDYYNYAWCKPETFTHPFIAQPSGDGNMTPGYTVNAKVRTLNALPFTKSLKFDMELWHWNKATINYAPTTFYYMKPGGKNNIAPDYKGAKEKVLVDYEELHKSEKNNS
ncbi:glycoside hydrolase family 172 protein [Flavivirga spongiicola]|uniref:DUF2961 domain-containing protein n=1 Tax=Flavivirga spongiicola TaxID=421621 RepID=A0ABU7XNQ2_9FLAO|nr:glycoside hydrolase family 172 protein [Flavivirga sp. MEBiC05379]MDO5977397.1 DUF2961 domain-containing protein [Flavivirga sp. MEBiC05379]